MAKPIDLAKYRRRHPAPDWPGPPDCRFAVVIPAFDEKSELPAVLVSLAAARADFPEFVAVLVVVNHPVGADAGASLELCSYLDTPEMRADGVFYLYAPNLIGGVGAARKIGMDCFVASLNAASAEKSVIFSLDADTVVEPDYFTAITAALKQNTCGGVAVGFRHRDCGTPEVERAVRTYEHYLANYVDRLRTAGSPYGFFSVGSAFAVRAAAYVRSGGMKVRRAGEDFYFLQELAKTSGVFSLDRVLVRPSPRLSDRTPFGTGPALRQLLAGEGPHDLPEAAFAGLEAVLRAARTPGALDDAAVFVARLPALAAEFFTAEKFPALWPKVLANQPPTSAARLAAFNRWFDGLKTLRLLHYLAAALR